MSPHPFVDILAALEEAGVRAVVVGGVAVIAHGHLRATADLDLVVDLERENLLLAVEVLTDLGLRPRLPVHATDLADEEKRTTWARDRGMTVFSFHDSVDPRREVDVFVDLPFPFEDLAADSLVTDLFGHRVRVAGLAHLLAMKRAAGRPRDLADIAELEALEEDG
jgi:hypothetical protein